MYLLEIKYVLKYITNATNTIYMNLYGSSAIYLAIYAIKYYTSRKNYIGLSIKINISELIYNLVNRMTVTCQ